jgi:hypothetical protein
MREAALLASLVSKRNESNTEQLHVQAWLSRFIFSPISFFFFYNAPPSVNKSLKKRIDERGEEEAKKLA